MIVICKNTSCTHNEEKVCTLDIIRIGRSGICEQCDASMGCDATTLAQEVEPVKKKNCVHKAMRIGGSLKK